MTAAHDQLRELLAKSRCKDLNHPPPRPPRLPGLEHTCNRCLYWAERRLEEFERAGLIRTEADRTNARALELAHGLLSVERRRSRVAIAAAAVVAVVAWWRR